MKNKALEYLKSLIEQKYGDLDNDRGCYVEGCWLSVKAVVELIERAEKEMKNLPILSGEEVVHCQECDFGKEDLICTNPLCTKSFYGCPVPPHHFCSYGRKENQ